VSLMPRDSQVSDPGEPAGSPRARFASPWVALPAAAGLIAIIAFASRSATLPAGWSLDASGAFTAVEVVGYVLLAIGLTALLLSILLFGPRIRNRSAAQRKLERELQRLPLWARILAFITVLALIAGQSAVLLAYLADILRSAIGAPTAPAGGTGDGLDPNAFGAADDQFTAITIALVVIVVLAAFAVAYAIRLRLSDDRLAAFPAGRQAAIAVEVSLEALRREPDPRRAVIAAYAAMERSLSAAGLARQHSEAPFEYLRRVLAEASGATEDVRSLTDLFQLAKFSQHAVDEGMRNAAIRALEGIRSGAVRAREATRDADSVPA
jgi:Domain of unknown function (DUF4129)